MPPAATHRRPQPLPACRPPGRCCRSGRAEREGARATPLPSWRCRARGRRRSPWPAASLPAPCSLPASAPPRPPGAGPGGRRPSAVAGGRGAAGAGGRAPGRACPVPRLLPRPPPRPAGASPPRDGQPPRLRRRSRPCPGGRPGPSPRALPRPSRRRRIGLVWFFSQESRRPLLLGACDPAAACRISQ